MNNVIQFQLWQLTLLLLAIFVCGAGVFAMIFTPSDEKTSQPKKPLAQKVPKEWESRKHFFEVELARLVNLAEENDMVLEISSIPIMEPFPIMGKSFMSSHARPHLSVLQRLEAERRDRDTRLKINQVVSESTESAVVAKAATDRYCLGLERFSGGRFGST